MIVYSPPQESKFWRCTTVWTGLEYDKLVLLSLLMSLATQYASPIYVVLQCKLVYSRGLRKWKSALPGFLMGWKGLHMLHMFIYVFSTDIIKDIVFSNNVLFFVGYNVTVGSWCKS